MTPPVDTNSSALTLWLLGTLAGVVVFLFKLLHVQMKSATEECKSDRDILRVKIDDNETKINELEVRTVRAETLAGVPCHLSNCPKLTSYIKKPKVIED